jgi:sulfur relay (sulfurtransferase) DsrC/TusE family protein
MIINDGFKIEKEKGYKIYISKNADSKQQVAYMSESEIKEINEVSNHFKLVARKNSISGIIEFYINYKKTPADELILKNLIEKEKEQKIKLKEQKKNKKEHKQK